MVYYNEHDPLAAAAIRGLMKEGWIAEGEVDERSIEEVRPDDLRGFSQCHFFAGGGFWSYALRLAGWPDDRPVWTGSCPCPSFSAAGKGKGFDDPRHLWPAWFGLIRECRPAVVFGEQVDAAIGHGWLDLVQSDLEGKAYSVGKAVLGACSVGAPHIRKRLWFVADNLDRGPEGRRGNGYGAHIGREDDDHGPTVAELRQTGRLAESDGRDSGAKRLQRGREHGQFTQDCGAGLLAYAELRRPEQCNEGQWAVSEPDADEPSGELVDAERERGPWRMQEPDTGDQAAKWGECRDDLATPGTTVNFWSDAEWLWCRDGKYRPTKPGLQCLAHGAPARVGRLRLYGNAIVPQVAAAFIEAYLNG